MEGEGERISSFGSLEKKRNFRSNIVQNNEPLEFGVYDQKNVSLSQRNDGLSFNLGITKARIRQSVWDKLERENLANFPRPVHHRIPNFKGADAAADRLVTLDEYKKAKIIKINPDAPQKRVRYHALSSGKIVLVPTPRLRDGLLNRIDPSSIPNGQLERAASKEGITTFGKPIGLKSQISIDLIIIGSVAVSRSGFRLGKGEGYAELEYGMMRCMNAINDSTVVITTIHDEQIVEHFPEELLQDHDLTVDIIVTPTQVIYCNSGRPKPKGIFWEKITEDMLLKMPILKTLKNINGTIEDGSVTVSVNSGTEPNCTLYVGNIPFAADSNSLKMSFESQGCVEIAEVTVAITKGNKPLGYAFVRFNDTINAKKALKKMVGVEVGGRKLNVSMARNR